MVKRASATLSTPWWAWLGLAAIVVLLDQFTKILILGFFELGHSQPVNSWLNMVRVHNPGAAFSFLARAGGWQRWFFVALALAAVALMVTLLRRHGGQALFSAALSLILGGALGNAIDRLTHGYVVDFIDCHWDWLSPWFAAGHFPAFNVADMAISLGAALLLLDELLRVRRS